MGSEMTKRNIQTLLHRFESLKTDTHKINRLTGLVHSRMYSCTHTHTHTHTHTLTHTHTYTHSLTLSLSLSLSHTHTHTYTHTHTHTRPGGSVVCVQLGMSRLPVYFRGENALTEPFGRLPYFLQVCGRLFRFIIDNRI